MSDKENEFIGPDGCYHESYKDYVFSEFGYMAYDGKTANLVLELLKELWDGQHPNHYFIRESENDYEWAFQAFMLEILASKDIIEYGTSPRGGWLTNKGKNLLQPLFGVINDKIE